jgi:rubrerythrin
MADDREITGTGDVNYDLVSVLYHSLQGAETYEFFESDAEEAGDQELMTFFREVREEEKRRADRAKALLVTRLQKGG